MKEKIKISAVSYFNTHPFLYGLEKSGMINNTIDLSLDYPSVCAEKVQSGEVDMGLVPIAIIPSLKVSYIASRYCIGSKGKVDSVLLVSDVPLHEIKQIYLDYQSKTSVSLVQILAKMYWNIVPEWIQAEKGYEKNISGTTAGVIIGDRTFNLIKDYKYIYDLSEEWYQYSNLPFVFAVWLATKPIAIDILNQFNKAIEYGVNNIDEVVDNYENKYIYCSNIRDYLKNKISYNLDKNKSAGMNRFLSYYRALQGNKKKLLHFI